VTKFLQWIGLREKAFWIPNEGPINYHMVQKLKAMGEDAVDPLIDTLNTGDARARQVAAEALGALRSPKAVAPLIAAIKDCDMDVRYNAVGALGAIGDPVAVGPINAAMNDHKSKVELGALWALARIGDPNAIDCLIAALKGSNKFLRNGAAKFIPYSSRTLSVLAAMLDDPEPYRSMMAAIMIASFFSNRANFNKPNPPDPNIVVVPLIRSLESRRGRPSEEAARALGAVGDRAAIEPLAKALMSGPIPLKSCAAEALGRIGRPEAIAALQKALVDSDETVREAADNALRHLADPKPAAGSDDPKAKPHQ
jgi:HEAT repeat protein